MRKITLRPYQWKLLWVVGLVILSILCFELQEHTQKISQDTYQVTPLIWINVLIQIVFGLYFSLLFVRSWSIKYQPTLLFCVALPCLVLALSFPVDATFSSVNHILATVFTPSIYQWLLKLYAMNAFGFIGSLTLVLSIFGGSQSKSKDQPPNE